VSYVIVGASTGLGRALAEEYAAGGNDLVLIARDPRDIAPLAAHLALRFAIVAIPVALDLATENPPLVGLDQALSKVSPLRGVLLPVGASDVDDQIGLANDALTSTIRVNFLNPCRLLIELLPRLDGGEVVGFGSVAGFRGRSRNAAYAASKRALESYFESLRHWGGSAGVAVRFYIPGYLDTNLAFGQKLPFRAASPQDLARLVRADTDRTCTRYFPFYWLFIGLLLRLLPWRVYRKLKF
jgi:short-subunit dehydrogenase